MKCDSCVMWCAVKCKETFLRKDTFQIWYRCCGGGVGARRETLILISPNTMEHLLLWRGNCRGPKVATLVEILKQQKQRKVTCVDVWTYSPYVAAEVPAFGTRLATNWQLFQITNFNVEDQRDSSSNQAKQVWLKSHILSSVVLKFWSEGPGSPLKLKLLDLYLRHLFFKSCYRLWYLN